MEPDMTFQPISYRFQATTPFIYPGQLTLVSSLKLAGNFCQDKFGVTTTKERTKN